MLLCSSHPDKTAHRLVGLSKDGNEGQKESNTFVIQSPKTLYGTVQNHIAWETSPVNFFHASCTFLTPSASLIAVTTNVWLLKNLISSIFHEEILAKPSALHGPC